MQCEQVRKQTRGLKERGYLGLGREQRGSLEKEEYWEPVGVSGTN